MTFLRSLSVGSVTLRYRLFSPSSAPRIRNSMQIDVFPVPTDPETRTGVPPRTPPDPADIQRAGPPEFFQDPDDLLLRRGIVPRDQHLGHTARVLRVDHLRIRDRVEALHDLRGRKEPLDPLAEGILRADEQPGRWSAGEVERIRDIDQNLGPEVLRPGEFDHILGRRPLDREEQDLAVPRPVREGG